MTDGCGHQLGLMDGSAAFVSLSLGSRAIGISRLDKILRKPPPRLSPSHLSLYLYPGFISNPTAVRLDHLPVFFFFFIWGASL